MPAVTFVGPVIFRFNMLASIAFVVENIRSYVVVSAVAPVTPFKPAGATKNNPDTRKTTRVSYKDVKCYMIGMSYFTFATPLRYSSVPVRPTLNGGRGGAESCEKIIIVLLHTGRTAVHNLFVSK